MPAFSSSFPFKFGFISNIPVISLVIPLPEMLPLWCTQQLHPIYYSCLALQFYKSMSQRTTFTPVPLSNCISSTEYLQFGSLSLPGLPYPEVNLVSLFPPCISESSVQQGCWLRVSKSFQMWMYSLLLILKELVMLLNKTRHDFNLFTAPLSMISAFQYGAATISSCPMDLPSVCSLGEGLPIFFTLNISWDIMLKFWFLSLQHHPPVIQNCLSTSKPGLWFIWCNEFSSCVRVNMQRRLKMTMQA